MATEKLLIDLLGINMEEVDTSDCTDVDDILSAVVTYLSELPTVDAVEVVHGYWTEYGIGRGRSFCSECGYNGERSINYCPNCGAKMDGDGNG